MTQKLQEYIEKHAFCSEYLFKDQEAFLDVLYAEGGRISSILWWDHCEKSQQHRSVGSGGFIDPSNPEYMYAETKLWKDGLGSWTLDAVKEYISTERATGLQYGSEYVSHDLIPSFYLCEQAAPFVDPSSAWMQMLTYDSTILTFLCGTKRCETTNPESAGITE